LKWLSWLIVDHVLGTVDAECGARLRKITWADHDHGLERRLGFLGQGHPTEKIINSTIQAQPRVAVVVASRVGPADCRSRLTFSMAWSSLSGFDQRSCG
jgi:hypothetical protein